MEKEVASPKFPECYQTKIDEILSHTPEEDREKIRSTLVSFAFLHQNAGELCRLPCVSTASLVERGELLFCVLDGLETPDCPELFEDFVPPDTIPFQKVNRNLFGEFDDEVKRIFRARYPTYPEEFLAFPIVEWAVNIIPVFSLEFMFRDDGETLAQKVVQIIRENYANDSLEIFLTQAWALIDAKWPPQSIDSWKGKGGMLERLGCSMCFPARVSILE
mmetsp:Transcript_8297/g.11123  ORF Transcript_8297/g.11123 Transcript_8297/m.11123 type:complete len:219 (+) Transcript_8297:72-728(+)|eukprot:CAMPEP_0201487768 /NCGR_PEP_ID=MMETSP0151_2-20130828/15219_1 /ASSEMBLY_ACC=CAM_ASM_000257 /TAXON_ID=200890 /ORGANISM="Paramoeba atlantica, Strain 621/1 / CCAP 1560/9" /LENGTH=218 /DNA_ID=CAMNT_0047872913 /DNA_START=49 /DNA_END=705 /DNA_ORIENTATION=+